MTIQDDFQKIERQISETNTKIDNLYKLVNQICNDLGVARGTRMFEQMADIRNQVYNMSREISPGEMKAISYQVQNIKKSLDNMNKKEYY